MIRMCLLLLAAAGIVYSAPINYGLQLTAIYNLYEADLFFGKTEFIPSGNAGVEIAFEIDETSAVNVDIMLLMLNMQYQFDFTTVVNGENYYQTSEKITQLKYYLEVPVSYAVKMYDWNLTIGGEILLYVYGIYFSSYRMGADAPVKSSGSITNDRIDFGPSCAAGYAVSDNLSLFIKYYHGLNNVYTHNEFQAHNRYAGIGIRYGL